MRIGLNPEQRAAVEFGEGPLLVLAGAGSGKTRVLTARVARLIDEEGVPPERILAVTFTNKAAGEMRERIEALLGRSTRGLWIGTFHSVCARILRREADRASRDRSFSIYDEDDALRTLKDAMERVGLDPKRWSPGAVRRRISDAKNAVVGPADYAPGAFEMLSRAAADVYPVYQRMLERRNAYDFDDLLFEVATLLERDEEVRERYARRFLHVLVDEYQDTNHAQYRIVKALARGHGNVCVVGDDDQCLLEGTLVTMADGGTKPIEEVRPSDRVLSGYGSGDFRPARVLRTYRREGRRDGIEVRTEAGRRIVSTPEHVHFAGYVRGRSPQRHFVYLMRKPLPFVPRKGKSRNGLVNDGERLLEMFRTFDTSASAARLMADTGLSSAHPHHRPQSRDGNRRTVRVTLCGDRRGRRPMHRISIAGNDEAGRRTLEESGLSVRPAGRRSRAWRFETVRADYGELMKIAGRIRDTLGGRIVRTARLGRNEKGARESNSLPFLPASAVRPGMVMFTGDGGRDRVRSVRRVELSAPVYDLDVEDTHNFVAEGLVTHNSIYGWRGADLRNILDFERDFPGTEVVRLERNYRSTGSILEVANAVIACNLERKPKRLRTERPGGEKVVVVEAPDERAEASWTVGEIQALGDAHGLADCAILYRTNAQSRAYEDALRAAGLPYRIVGGVRFYERREIKDALAYLQLAVNPADAAAFERAVSWPRRGVGAVTLERLAEAARERGETLLETARRAEAIEAIPTAGAKSLVRFAGEIGELAELQRNASPRAMLEETARRFGMAAALEEEEGGEDRLANLAELVSVAAEYDRAAIEDADAEATDLELFLQSLALRSEIDEADLEGEAVTLMTLHNAKGLEFPVVFVGGLEEGLFPLARAYEAEGGLEEERRLFYVGVTRAMDRLYLTHAERRWRYGQSTRSGPSAFLDEVPEGPARRRIVGGGRRRAGSGGGRRRGGSSGTPWRRATAGNGGPGRDGGSGFSWRHDPAASGSASDATGQGPEDGDGGLRYDYADSQVPLEVRPGARVVHPRFGEGEIVAVSGQGSATKAEIEFDSVGRKKVMVAYAGLRPA